MHLLVQGLHKSALAFEIVGLGTSPSIRIIRSLCNSIKTVKLLKLGSVQKKYGLFLGNVRLAFKIPNATVHSTATVRSEDNMPADIFWKS